MAWRQFPPSSLAERECARATALDVTRVACAPLTRPRSPNGRSRVARREASSHQATRSWSFASSSAGGSPIVSRTSLSLDEGGASCSRALASPMATSCASMSARSRWRSTNHASDSGSLLTSRLPSSWSNLVLRRLASSAAASESHSRLISRGVAKAECDLQCLCGRGYRPR